MSDGGITVTKTTTGVTFIPDIKVYVPHREAVYIPANDALSSVDLHRALNTKEIFQLLSSIPQTSTAAPQEDLKNVSLEMENRILRDQLARSQQQGTQLQSSMTSLETLMGQLLTTVKRIDEAPKVVMHQGAAGVATMVTEAVGGDVPIFLPDNIVPSDANVHIEVEQTSSDSDKVSAAASKLRELRRGRTG
jgi:hypothetical protein